VLVSLLKGLDHERIDAWVACHETGPMVAEYRRHAAGVVPINFRDWFSAANIRTLRRLMLDLRCHVVHTHLFRADLQAGIAAAFARVPIRIATIHGEYWRGDGDERRRVLRRTALSRTYRAAYRLFDRVIAVAPRVAEDLVSRPGWRVRRRQVTVIRSGCDVIPATPSEIQLVREALGLPPSAPVLVTVANFFHAKGHRILVDAMPAVLVHHPQATLLLVGDGPLLPEVQRQVQRLNLEPHVRFIGSHPHPERFLALADAVVVPSLSEGFPIVLLEALGLCRAVVATAVGGIPDVIDDGRSGLLVPAGDPRALAGAVDALLADPPRARALAAEGHARVRSRFSEAAMIGEIERLYFSLAAEKGLVLS
jgi:glycosyltransferase involved in cell wall biosynthesis